MSDDAKRVLTVDEVKAAKRDERFGVVRRGVRVDFDALLATVEALKQATAQLERLRFKGFIGGEMRTQEHALALDKMRADLEAARAQAAQMREALERVAYQLRHDQPEWEHDHEDEPPWEECRACTYEAMLRDTERVLALSSDAGKGYVSPERFEAEKERVAREAWGDGCDYGAEAQAAGTRVGLDRFREQAIERILKGGA